jgi:hypothetical protein
MDIVGQDVKHKVFGVGTIIEMDDKQIVVRFSVGLKKFAYPSAFEDYLTLLDSSVHNSIQLEILALKKAKTEAEQLEREAAARKLAEIENSVQHHRKQIKAAKSAATGSSTSSTDNTRIQGKRSTFFVFQGNTFERQCRGGYLWAPAHENGNKQVSFGENLFAEVRAGDVIFHGCNGLIAAISNAKDQCYDALQPEELLSEKLWGNEGRKIDCDYTLIKYPIKTAFFRAEIKKYSSGKYAPFDKDGHGNTGYFYNLDRKLARIFIKELVKKNYELLDLNYVQELLNG